MTTFNTETNLYMIFRREDMLFRSCSYDWNEKDNCRTFVPLENNDGKLNRKDGNEVLDFINGFCAHYNAGSCNSCHKIEIMIKEAPEELQERFLLSKWILHHWDEY